MKTCRWAVLTLLCVLITLVCLPLSAQDSDRAKAGERVRFRFSGETEQEIERVFRGIEDGQVLVCHADRGELLQFPSMKVRHFQVNRGIANHGSTGTVVGVLSGALVTVVHRPEGDSSGGRVAKGVCLTAEEKRIRNGILSPCSAVLRDGR